MSLVVTGLSHHSSRVELRERLVFADSDLPEALRRLHQALDGAAAVILSTCNRVEVYAHQMGMPPGPLTERLRAFLADWHHLPESEFADELYAHADHDAVGHLFRVSSSLDSLVVGETQIRGQVNDAFLAAQTAGTTDKVMRNLFQKAFAISKKVRSRTSIASGRVSVSSVAVELAESIFSDLSSKTCMVIGSGEMGANTLKHLAGAGVGNIILANRSIEKAEALAGEFNGEAVALAQLDNHLHRADIIITSTAAPDYILGPDDFQQALRQRDQEPMFVIDIAVPRDVDPIVNEIDNVYLYSVDDLQHIADENLRARREEMAECLEMVDQAVENFDKWLQGLVAEPTIVSLGEELNAIRELELRKTLSSLPDLSEKQREEVAYLTQRIVNTILERPMRRLKQEVTHHDPPMVLHLVKKLFGLKEER